MMSAFAVPARDDVSPANQALFDTLKKSLGMTPNLYATLGYSQTALGTYLALQSAKSSLSAKEREVINLAVSQVNDCAYCLAAHTVLAGMNGFTPEQILDLRRGRAPFDSQLDALARFARVTTEGRGKPGAMVTDGLLAAGYTKGQMVDAIVAIGDKIITNYLHGVTQVPVDFPAAPALTVAA
jgi:AhpD family alkylhydroperoxidase